MTTKNESFLIGVGIGYLIEKYHGDIVYGISCWCKENQRKIDIENARVIDPFGDEIQ